MSETLTAMSGSVLAAATVNVGRGSPNRGAPVSRQLAKGDPFNVIGVTVGENVAGEANWYVGEGGEFVWAGAARAAAEDGFLSGVVKRRGDGAIRPRLPAELREIYKPPFAYKEGRGGAVTLDPPWAQNNIVTITAPASILGGVRMEVHKLVKPFFERVLHAIDGAGLGARVVTFDGGFVPRHMGWNPGRELSSHTWGVAIDINARWNGYGATPAALGEYGSVRELVPFFAAEGFAWGGHF